MDMKCLAAGLLLAVAACGSTGAGPAATRAVPPVRRAIALAAAACLATACSAPASTGTGRAAAPPRGHDIEALRAQAGLEPCPPALAVGLPDVTLRCLADDSPVHVSGAPGRPLLINFYNTACGPCQEEFPLLRQYYDTAPDVGLVGVDAQDSPVAELAFVRDFRARWPAISDPDGTLFRRFAGGWPVTIAVRADGTVAASKPGTFKTIDEIEAFAQKAL